MKTTASRCCEFQAAPCEISAIKIPSFSIGNPIFNHVVECAERKFMKGFSLCCQKDYRMIIFQIFFEVHLLFGFFSYRRAVSWLHFNLSWEQGRAFQSCTPHVCRISKTEILWSWFQILKSTGVWSKQGKIILCLKNILKYSFIDTDLVFNMKWCFKFTIGFWGPINFCYLLELKRYKHQWAIEWKSMLFHS